MRGPKVKSILFACLLAFATPSRGGEAINYDGIIAFDTHWVKFINDLAGCPSPGAPCTPAQGRVNYAEFLKSRNAARQLFSDR